MNNTHYQYESRYHLMRMTSDWTAQTIVALDRAGYRSGGARRVVIELLGRQDCCLTAQEIFDS